MTKDEIWCVKDNLRCQKLFNALESIEFIEEKNKRQAIKTIEFLEKENEELEKRVSYLEDKLKKVEKEKEDMKYVLANGVKEFINEQPFSSFTSLLFNEKLKTENELLKKQIEIMKCCCNCKNYFECSTEKGNIRYKKSMIKFPCCWKLKGVE